MGPKKAKKAKKSAVKDVVQESEYDTMDLEMLREVVPMLRQQLDKSMLDRNYVQLERDAIQQYFDITHREVSEVQLAIEAKDREMELLEDNHRVELRVYQQKVKHLEYEHKNNIREIVKDGTNWLDSETYTHQKRESELLKKKESLKIEKFEKELLQSTNVTELRQQHDKQLSKLRQNFDESLGQLVIQYDKRFNNLLSDLDLQRCVEIHEVEERKNQHINDLIKNHKKAFGQMKSYYNDITSNNLKLIKDFQRRIAELKENTKNNKKLLIQYTEENQRLSEPLQQVSSEIASFNLLLRERQKDQMALKNAHNRFQVVVKEIKDLKVVTKTLEEDYRRVEYERDHLYNSFEDTLNRIRQQSDFHSQSLEQKLMTSEMNLNKMVIQRDELISASNMDTYEIAKLMESINAMVLAKQEHSQRLAVTVAKVQKTFNDSYEAVRMRFKELGIPEADVDSWGFDLETLPASCTSAPAGLISSF